MAVSSVSSSSSTSAQQYGGNDDDTTPTNNNPPPSSKDNDIDNTPSPQTDGNDAENPSSAQKDSSQGQSTLSQFPPADTNAGTQSPSPDNETGNASSTPTNAPAEQSTSAQTQPANTSATTTSSPPTLSSTEATQLLSRLDNDTSIPDDAANASNMAGLQGDSLRGADAESINFERLATVANQQAGALPPDKRDFYGGALAAASTYYNAATTSDQRAHIADPVYSQVIGPIRATYLQAMGDPNARVQMTFSKPFGSIYLGNAGQQQSDLLAQMGQQFNHAATPEERARIFGQAVDLRHTMQSQIGAFVDQDRSRVQEQWKQADQEIDQALRDAAGMQIAGSDSGFDNTSSFHRLDWFITHGLNSERNAQEFQYRLSKSPDDFKLLHDWSADATQKAEWATSAIQSDPFRRTPELPPLPPDPTRTTTENSRMGNFGADLLYRYQQEDRRILDAKDMYHAASQRGPIRNTYLDAHTPPLPLWQQQLEDGLGRFFVGILPGVNLLVDYIVPARSLPEWARQGIDFASAVVGAVVPVPEIPIKLPKLGDVGELNPFKKLKPAEEIKAADEIKPVEANAHGEPVNAPKPELSTAVPESATPTSGSTSGIPLVPEEYSRSPSGKLIPEPDYRGLYRDEGGQHYIQQDGKTYPVDWNDTAHRWQMKPREGSPNAPKMHINEKGNWEVDLDTGLKGGMPPRAIRDMRQAFDLYESGQTLELWLKLVYAA